MSFATPFFAWLAGGVALATVALHLLAWRRPPESPLPTARFAPQRPIRMVSRALRPSDLALLALRVLLVLLAGFALAGPILATRRAGMGRVVVIDRSFGGDAGAAIATSARTAFRPGDALVVFDSLAREISSPTVDSIAFPAASPVASGSLSAALVAAQRPAMRLERERDSVEIVIVSPFVASEIDAATAAIRRTWPGPLRLVRAGAPPNDTSALARPAVRATSGDAVAASLALAGGVHGGTDVRVVRDAPTAADTAWARDGRVLVVWPAAATRALWNRRTTPDTSFAVTVIASGQSADRAATVVAPFLRESIAPPGRAIARWSDGEPAVTEATLGTGCVRAVAVPVPNAGDLALTPSFQRFARRMAEPCGLQRRESPVSDSELATILPTTVSDAARERSASIGGATPKSPLTPWLLGLALVAAAAEMIVRRGESHATG